MKKNLALIILLAFSLTAFANHHHHGEDHSAYMSRLGMTLIAPRIDLLEVKKDRVWS